MAREVARACGGFEVRHCEDPGTGALDAAAERGALRLVVVDEDAAEATLARVPHLPERGAGIDWALSYGDPQRARAVIGLCRARNLLRDLRFLPRDLPPAGWATMFRLVLCGPALLQARALADLPAGGPVPPPPGRATAAALRHPGPQPCASARRTPGAPHGSTHGPPLQPPEARGRAVALTPREEEVLRLVAGARRNKTIGHELSIAEQTVKLHLHHIMRKIGVRNRTAAAAWYLARQNASQP